MSFQIRIDVVLTVLVSPPTFHMISGRPFFSSALIGSISSLTYKKNFVISKGSVTLRTLATRSNARVLPVPVFDAVRKSIEFRLFTRGSQSQPLKQILLNIPVLKYFLYVTYDSLSARLR